MNKNQLARFIMFIIIILLFLLLGILIFIIIYNKDNNGFGNLNDNNTNSIEVTTPKKTEDLLSIKEVVEAHKSKYISTDSRKIYVEFAKDLYDEDGKSNENYYKNLSNDLIRFFMPDRFYLIDESKKITVTMEYDTTKKEYKMMINGQENFFENTDGDSYINVDNVSITPGTHIYVNVEMLQKLNINGLYLHYIEDDLGEGRELSNGYTSYQNGTIRIRTLPSKAVKNIIFCNDYEGYITSKIKYGMSLSQILEQEPNITFGGLDKGYLGYRDYKYYTFFYKDEVSLYTYTYQKNKEFEEVLDEYIKTKDLKKFANNIEAFKFYDSYEYNEEKKSLKVLVCSKGIDINITDNDTKGITLYSNYYFTENVKEYVKNGIISYNGKEDLVDKTERERRANFLNQ